LQALYSEYHVRKTTDVEERVTIRTLSARIHSPFSSLLNALHSFRISGFVHGAFLGSGEQETAAVDKRMARAIEKTLKTNILGLGAVESG
jgi:hypothetical protein